MNHPTTCKPIYRFSLIRVLVMSVLLSLLVAGCLYLHHTVFTDARTHFLDAESKSIAWMVRELGYMLPFIVIALFQYAVYHRYDREDGILQREMMWEMALVALLTYAVLLPYVCHLSDELYAAAKLLTEQTGEKLPQTEGKVDRTLAMDLHQWFVRLSIPLALLGVYHGSRASREHREALVAHAEPAHADMSQPEGEAPIAEEVTE